MPDQVLHFGKHKGKPISQVPLGYLEWIILNVGEHEAVKACTAELDRRGSAIPAPKNTKPTICWRQEMARTHYLWQGWHGNQEWIPFSVDMSGREYEEPPFDVEPWDVEDAP